MAAVTPGPGGWGLNIGGFMDAHRGWLIRGRGGWFGWTAQRRDATTGRPRGPVLDARTLDELAALIQAARLPSGGSPLAWPRQT